MSAEGRVQKNPSMSFQLSSPSGVRVSTYFFPKCDMYKVMLAREVQQSLGVQDFFVGVGHLGMYARLL